MAHAWSPRVRTRPHKVWDIAREQPLTTLLGHTGPVCAVAWSPDGTRVVTASADKTARCGMLPVASSSPPSRAIRGG